MKYVEYALLNCHEIFVGRLSLPFLTLVESECSGVPPSRGLAIRIYKYLAKYGYSCRFCEETMMFVFYRSIRSKYRMSKSWFYRFLIMGTYNVDWNSKNLSRNFLIWGPATKGEQAFIERIKLRFKGETNEA